MAVVEPVGCCKGSVCVCLGCSGSSAPFQREAVAGLGMGHSVGAWRMEPQRFCPSAAGTAGQGDSMKSLWGAVWGQHEQRLGSSVVLGTLHFAARVVQQSVASPLPSLPGSTLAFSS